MITKYTLTLVLLLSMWLGAAATPTVHYGPAPRWVVHTTREGKVPDQREVNDGYFLRLYEYEDNLETDETYHRIVREIISDVGVQAAANVYVEFDPTFSQLTIHSVTVWRDGKPLDRLDRKELKLVAREKEMNMFVYNGSYTAWLIIKDVRKGDKIEYTYTIKGSNPIFFGRYHNQLSMQGSDPISGVHYRIIAPPSQKLTLKYFNGAPKPQQSEEGHNVVYDWDLLDLPGSDHPDNAPSWYSASMSVQLSGYAGWNEVAEWGCRINAADEHLVGELQDRIRKLQAQYGADSAALFRSLVQIVQNEVRYMGVEMGANSHKAHDPAKVYAQRYGDCKDKALLLVSMLHSAGIAAEMAIVDTRDKDKIDENLPSPSSFNHAIVRAHLSGKTIWVDATISNQGGAGTDISCPDYGHALILAPGVTDLQAMNGPPPVSIKYSEDYNVDDEAKQVTFIVRTEYSGYEADGMRETFANNSRSQLENEYTDYYAKIYPGLERRDTLSITDDIAANKLTTTERYTIPQLYEFDSARNLYYADFYASLVKSQLPAVGKTKSCPIALNYPYHLHYTINISTRSQWQSQPQRERINRNAYEFLYEVSGGSFRRTVEFDLKILKDHIAPGDIAQYEKDRKKIVDDLLSYRVTSSRDTKAADDSDPTHIGTAMAVVLIFAVITFLVVRRRKSPPRF